MDLLSDEQMRIISNNGMGNRFEQNQQNGYNPAVSSSTVSDIWFNAVNLVYPTTARTLTVQSTTNDTDGGTGARTVIINGLNANWEEIEETVTLNQAVDPTTDNEFIRVNKCQVDEVGSQGFNDGSITFTTTTDDDIQANIEATLGTTQKSHYSVPLGRKLTIAELMVSGGKGEDFEVSLMCRKFGKSWCIIHRELVYQDAVSENVLISVPAKSDVKIQALSLTGNAKPINCSYVYMLSPDTYL